MKDTTIIVRLPLAVLVLLIALGALFGAGFALGVLWLTFMGG